MKMLSGFYHEAKLKGKKIKVITFSHKTNTHCMSGNSNTYAMRLSKQAYNCTITEPTQENLFKLTYMLHV